MEHSIHPSNLTLIRVLELIKGELHVEYSLYVLADPLLEVVIEINES